MIFPFFLASLACFRLTRLITDDKITSYFRQWVIAHAPRRKKTLAKEGITCPFCVSVYIAILLTAYFMFFLGMTMVEAMLWMPAVWGASILWNQLFVYLTNEHSN
jgi:hypothetical protein